MSIAADGERLYIAQWGGWSEFDGKTWTHYLDVAELQGLAITALYPQGNVLWIGTQSRGLAEFNRATGQLHWYDERHGLLDDWITCITPLDKTLCAGTFVGGLTRLSDSNWVTYPELEGQNITWLEPDERGGLFIATRSGLWYQSSDTSLRKLNERLPFLDTEVQAVSSTRNGLWIGTRTGIYFVPHAELYAPHPTIPPLNGVN